MTDRTFLDAPPSGEVLTAYDMAHLTSYLRLLDAAADPTATWQDAAQIILGIDPAVDPDSARRIHDAHLARARWMTEVGYRQLAAFERARWR